MNHSEFDTLVEEDIINDSDEDEDEVSGGEDDDNGGEDDDNGDKKQRPVKVSAKECLQTLTVVWLLPGQQVQLHSPQGVIVRNGCVAECEAAATEAHYRPFSGSDQVECYCTLT